MLTLQAAEATPHFVRALVSLQSSLPSILQNIAHGESLAPLFRSLFL